MKRTPIQTPIKNRKTRRLPGGYHPLNDGGVRMTHPLHPFKKATNPNETKAKGIQFIFASF